MTDDLYEAVLTAAAGDDSLSQAAQDALLEALANDGIPTQRATSPDDQGHKTSYLRSILVEGFRGIGQAATLSLPARPGLIVVAGRNGSGKSSLAEALEVVLTQDSHRWKSRENKVFRDTWRNLHHDNPTRVVVEFETPQGRIKALADWPTGAAFNAPILHTQRATKPQVAGLGDLGWGKKIDLHRPFLTYDELGALLEPNELFDVLSKVLGLERLSATEKRLSERVSNLKKPKTTASKQKSELRHELAEHPDQRAKDLDAALAKRAPDVKLIATFVTHNGESEVDQVLRQIAELEVPAPDALLNAVRGVVAATEKQAEANQSIDRAAADAAALLQQAVAFYNEHGECACPVCGQGQLDSDWQANSRIALMSRSEAQKQHAEAERKLADARQALQAVIPGALRQALLNPSELSGWSATRQALAEWDAATQQPSTVKDALAEQLCDQVSKLVAEAQELQTERDDAWRPIALAVATWLQALQEANDVSAELAGAEAAHAWLKKHHHRLRDERLEPIAERARAIWAELRQESNVDLGAITLEGTAKSKRSVVFNANVDGSEVGALGVMSQGELHALALSIFLPRATRADSPFGFLVIDDPVQAMDPAKVDGLARVLEQTAKDRQVVVFTHDDRLPEAVRRLDVKATILQVNRETDSHVAVSESSDPASRCLSDARAVASDQALQGTETERKAVQLLCREALEYVCREVFFAKGLRKGLSRRDLEDIWSQNPKTSPRLKLALHLDPKANIDQWLGNDTRNKALGVCTAAVHKEIRDPHGAIDAVTATIDQLRKTHG